jgi:signal transduction histidine kinase
VIAFAVCLVQVGVTVLAATHGHHSGRINAISIALLTVGPLALIGRDRYPAAVLAFCFAVSLVYSLSDYYPRGVVFLALIVAFWSAMMAGRRRLGWLSIIAGYVLFVAVLPLVGAQSAPSLAWASGIAAWMLLLGGAGEIVRVRRERALHAAIARSEQARRVAGEERLRIARELHDVLAHNLSLINVQAGVALHLIDERPEQTRAALTAIKQASKDALGELRSVLDVLRQPEENAPRTPTDGLGRLEPLIARTRDAGVPIIAEIEGVPRSLPVEVDLAAYRIIQEALTNVTRHAAGAATRVHVAYRAGELAVQVDSDASNTSPAGARAGGNGIRGMRERATALGGNLDAGPRPTGGFRVLARLPLDLTSRPGATVAKPQPQ